MPPPHQHGNFRGSDSPPRSRSFEGRFGRMFRHLPPARFGRNEEDALKELGASMIADPLPHHAREPLESQKPAGYTFLGQFIAHDITFDPASSLDRQNDPDALVNFRTPRLDLDCVYGRGPADQPYLYERDGLRMLLGDRLDSKKDWDVPRVGSTELAIIGDPRNDENVIIVQLHAIFLRLHNRMVDKRRGDFEAAQRDVRWHYQWVVLYDFLQKIVNDETYNSVLPHVGSGSDILKDRPKLRYFKPRENAFLPVEFSAAAYRFGHSTIRQRYELNRIASTGGEFAIFGDIPREDLRGFRRFNTSWFIDWGLFFEGISEGPVQRSRRIGSSLSAPLETLPKEVARDKRSLAELNLIRGLRMGLPSGQAVARAMGEKPVAISNEQFSENAPLWYYILAEAEEKPYRGEKLGPVGGRIVMETLVGLMMADGHSYLRQDPQWKPREKNPEKFDMADLIKLAIG